MLIMLYLHLCQNGIFYIKKANLYHLDIAIIQINLGLGIVAAMPSL
jgi:hypothetical protein